METVTLKVFLHKLDSSVEVRRIPMGNLSARGPQQNMNGQFGLLLARIASTFPSLRDRMFDVTWKDSDGDSILMSSDVELLEALAASNGQILKLYITEKEMSMKNGSGEKLGVQPQVIPTAPPHPYFEHGPIVGQGQYGMPGLPPYPSSPGHPHMPPPPPPAILMPHGNPTPMPAPSRMAAGPCVMWDGLPETASGDKKAWKTALRTQVPAPHRRWAKGYMRQWRSANVENATTSSSSDGEKGRKITREEAGVPETYVQWLDVILPKMHKSWAKDKPEQALKEFKEIKTTVPVEFQDWCRWYLVNHFEPKRKPELKSEVKDKACGGKDQTKDWKAMKKESKKAVPREYRIWTKIFVKQWEEENLEGIDNASSSSGTETEGEAEAAASLAEEITIPADYPRWLRKFLNFKYALNKSVTWKVPDQKVVYGGWAQFKDSVPSEYRKWAKSYVNLRLNKVKKPRKHVQEVAHQPSDNYQKWLFAFQRKWLEQVGGNQGATPMHAGSPAFMDRNRAQFEGDAHFGTHNQVFDMERLRDVVDSSDSEDDSEGSSQQNKIPKDFRQWARAALNQWDGLTLPYGATQQGSTVEHDNIPPRTLNWMLKIMTKVQMRRMKAQLRAERQQIKAQRREEKAEKKAAKQGFKAAKRSLKVARQAIKFRYV